MNSCGLCRRKQYSRPERGRRPRPPHRAGGEVVGHGMPWAWSGSTDRLVVLIMPPDGRRCGGQLRIGGAEVAEGGVQPAGVVPALDVVEDARRSPALVGQAGGR